MNPRPVNRKSNTVPVAPPRVAAGWNGQRGLLFCDRATVEYHVDMPDEHLPPIHVDVANNDIDFIIRWLSPCDGTLSLHSEVSIIMGSVLYLIR